MDYEVKLQGVCAGKVRFSVENDIVKGVRFIGGCSGNTQGVAALAEGMHIDELISRLQGIRCGMKSTSCPDQFAKALLSVKA